MWVTRHKSLSSRRWTKNDDPDVRRDRSRSSTSPSDLRSRAAGRSGAGDCPRSRPSTDGRCTGPHSGDPEAVASFSAERESGIKPMARNGKPTRRSPTSGPPERATSARRRTRQAARGRRSRRSPGRTESDRGRVLRRVRLGRRPDRDPPGLHGPTDLHRGQRCPPRHRRDREPVRPRPDGHRRSATRDCRSSASRQSRPTAHTRSSTTRRPRGWGVRSSAR
jgi:hypothetical protein